MDELAKLNKTVKSISDNLKQAANESREIMNELNAIILNGKAYETVKGDCNKKCAFWADKECASWCDYCTYADCYFRFSQELTDKIKKK